jgi:hypothetical protein
VDSLPSTTNLTVRVAFRAAVVVVAAIVVVVATVVVVPVVVTAAAVVPGCVALQALQTDAALQART